MRSMSVQGGPHVRAGEVAAGVMAILAISLRSAGGTSIAKVTNGVGLVMACAVGWVVGRKASLISVVVEIGVGGGMGQEALVCFPPTR